MIRALEVCPVEVAVSVLGGTWKLTLVKHLLDGPRRFNELGRLVPSANTKTLTRQLRELESDGVVHRTVFAEVPPRVEYRLTRLGRTLEPVVEVMDRWGAGFAEAYIRDAAEKDHGHRTQVTGRTGRAVGSGPWGSL
ncbi:Transcriptional regulator, HxlR family [Pseudonocardia sp. Ae706_Ps2]|nr:Transcriptional regulator, HxlR family [Pseudonocardia sp. Ae331_Ps2]OLM11912.1 Transcriptional regulator, HxlR family [Pseudonocardia sp. Ae505_Ps2]OLM24770.1 Transcriptional regulator, HxlR family [Pseudonocardia sp. Ae706_Ps2]